MPDFKALKERARQQTPEPKTGVPVAAGEEERHYRAFRLATRNLIAITVRLIDGARMQFPYVYFRGGDYWPKGDYVQLDFGDKGLVHLWGSRLLELEELIGEGNIRALEEFNPDRWGAPPEGEPVILRIEVQEVGQPAPDELEIAPPVEAQH